MMADLWKLSTKAAAFVESYLFHTGLRCSTVLSSVSADVRGIGLNLAESKVIKPRNPPRSPPPTSISSI